MGFDELNLLYTYKFGFGIKDALRFAGFDGGFQDFIVKQKVFTVLDGQVSMAPMEPPQCLLTSEAPAEVPDEGLNLHIAEESSANGIQDNEDDSHIIDVPAWQALGSRLVQVIGSPDLKVDLFETDSDAPTESTDVCSPLVPADCFETSSPSPGIDYSDTESEIDVTGWHSVGCRVAMALDGEDDFDLDSWEEAGSSGFKAVRFASDVEDSSEPDLTGNTSDASDVTDVKAWADVGSRIAAACNRCHDDDDQDVLDHSLNTDEVE